MTRIGDQQLGWMTRISAQRTHARPHLRGAETARQRGSGARGRPAPCPCRLSRLGGAGAGPPGAGPGVQVAGAGPLLGLSPPVRSVQVPFRPFRAGLSLGFRLRVGTRTRRPPGHSVTRTRTARARSGRRERGLPRRVRDGARAPSASESPGARARWRRDPARLCGAAPPPDACRRARDSDPGGRTGGGRRPRHRPARPGPLRAETTQTTRTAGRYDSSVSDGGPGRLR
jgi:hypothetical protein